jgi:hypothetical protein
LDRWKRHDKNKRYFTIHPESIVDLHRGGSNFLCDCYGDARSPVSRPTARSERHVPPNYGSEIGGDHASDKRTLAMKTFFAFAIVTAAVILAPLTAVAQDRGSDAAMGAVSGLVVGGPVGAVVGGVVGYTAGPAIAQGMGLQHRHYYYDSYGHRHYSYR